MADVFPSFENIDRLKVKPTTGESFLISYLANNLTDDYEIYFQPFFNGDFPDVVVMKKGAGVMIIEVKDWSLDSYRVDEKNEWHVKNVNTPNISPFQQAFGYKSNMFRLHINGLAEKSVMNDKFYGVIKPFVYFHGVTKSSIETLYAFVSTELFDSKNTLKQKLQNREIDHVSYTKQMDYLDGKSRQVGRDQGLALHADNLNKLIYALKQDNALFTDEIYDQFGRYLKPPYHVASQGIDIEYDDKQSKLATSHPGFQKIKGVAGSGKTTILAKRAVNAHKRHQDTVLILTFNKTLRNFIRDRISEVREDFSWKYFGITNYHSFISQGLNSCGIKVSPPQSSSTSSYWAKLYSDESLFDEHIDGLHKYKTILIDEVQDYQPEWIKIIRKFFLSDDGEMVLFGDESQNIYGRNISRSNAAIVQGFGRWERLTKSYRTNIESPLTAMSKAFQIEYLLPKYDIDLVDVSPTQTTLSYDIMRGSIFSSTEDVQDIYRFIFESLRTENIHPNDVTIISTNIKFLRALDQIIRTETNEKTQTTFESEEAHINLQQRHKSSDSDLRMNLEEIRGSLKFAFNLNSGLVKLSTVHSFKGLESSTCIYILLKEDDDEMVYTGITRATKNIIVFVQDTSKYLKFFEGQPGMKFQNLEPKAKSE